MKLCVIKRWMIWLTLLAAVLVLTACGSSDDDDNDLSGASGPEYNGRPILFVHGGAGSAAQFESQAQRFLANGVPLSYLNVYEYNTRLNPTEQEVENNAGINAMIDELLQANDAEQVDLIGHSMGTMVSQLYLNTPENAAKVAHYVNVDGQPAEALPGGVPTLAMWGQASPDEEIVDALNDHNAEQSHIQVCTSAESFAKIFEFFTGTTPATNQIPPAAEDSIDIAGRANIFPENIGAAGRTLRIYEVDPVTGFQVDPAGPVAELPIGEDGQWGPVMVTKGVTYMFALEHDTEDNADHYFYREPFMADDYFIRLNTSNPGEGLGSYMVRSADQSNLNIGRDMEMWGDQAANNDILTVDGINVLTPLAAAQSNRLSSLFLFDMGPEEQAPSGLPDPNYDGIDNLETPNTFFQNLPFISALDLFIPASSPPDRTISVVLTSRTGGGATQTINVPNWPSDEIRSISIQFRDFVQ